VHWNDRIQTTNYDELAVQEKLRQDAEEARLLYVGATRARDYLVLPWFATRGHYLELLKQAFDPALAGEAIATFFRRTGEQSRAKTQPFEATGIELGAPDANQRRELERQQKQRVEWMQERASLLERLNAGRSRSTPSRLKQALGESVLIGREGGTGAAMLAASFGTAMHQVLALMDFASPTSGDALWRTNAVQAGLSEEDTKRGLTTLQRFSQTNLFRRISQATTVYRELPFAYRQGETLMEGTLDLVFCEGTEWFLVDYKTDRVAAGEAASYVERYRTQLQAYAEALQILGGIRPAKILALLWTGETIRL
jgi:ATP-dependent helicase/nuclease subunit A